MWAGLLLWVGLLLWAERVRCGELRSPVRSHRCYMSALLMSNSKFSGFKPLLCISRVSVGQRSGTAAVHVQGWHAHLRVGREGLSSILVTLLLYFVSGWQ